jgi:carbohydrate kinase (thermoresistant glucokinase family)
MSSTPPLLVVMGVSGAGKSTVGAALAAELGVPFRDADDLHPAANVALMAAGQPLSDTDRWPWLDLVGAALASAEVRGTGLVMACSALRRVYRERILAAAPTARFVLLEVPPEVLEARMLARPGHFMPPSLLASQLATLEALGADEPGVSVPATASVSALVAELAKLG